MLNKQKCAVIGCGFVGATIAYTLMQNGLFSEMVLIDVDENKARGEEMDLNHGIPFAKPADIYAGGYKDLHDAQLVIITAGAGQKEGQTRTDLVDQNLKIFRTIIGEVAKYNKECILLIVSNPVDTLTYAAIEFSGFPKNRVIGSGTVLDTARLKYLMGQHLEVDYRNIHAFIIGEHGDSEFAVWSSANVSGIDLEHFCEECGKCNDLDCLHDLFTQVRDSAYEVIKCKGATYYAIAQAVLRICEAIVRDEDSVLPVCTYVDGPYGLHDVCIGLPCIVGRSGVKRILEFPLSESEHQSLEASAEAISSVIRDSSLRRK